ncbi:MAG: hypothetical protein ABI628_07575 [Chloroflexota bacterium]
MSEPRVLTIMGSGETAPTMARVHRALFERLGPRSRPVPATVIDTPYGFQENADDISARIVEYFAVSIGRPMTVASYRSSDIDAVSAGTALARIGKARYVLAGPGSPSYALRHWAGGPIPAALAAKLADGGAVTMASAAALTAGIVTIPVYEIYKVGADPQWLAGLDLLGPATGLRAAIVPHFDNAEGGNHDTRFCYIGERRLRTLERLLPPDVFVLGVDGHTGLVLDLDERTARVFGLGGVTIRVAGRGQVFPSGTATTIDALADAARDLAGRARDDESTRPETAALPSEIGAAGPFEGILQAEVAGLERAFVDALVGRDIPAALGALLAIDAAIERRGADDDGPELQAARATSRSLVVRLAEGAHDPRETVAPYVETLLELRSRARAAQDWATADLLRERLTTAGVEVRDDAAGSSWTLVQREDRWRGDRGPD